MRRRTVLGVLLLLGLVLSGCAERSDSHVDLPCVDVVEVARYGHAELVREGLDEVAIDAGGGILGDIRGMTLAPNGSLWVLDRSWYKVVAFRPDGSVERVVLGGRGEGPGEFHLPIHMAPTETGVSVVDYELRRITRFDWTGALEDLAPVRAPSPFRHVVRGDTTWIAPGGGTATTTSILFPQGIDEDVVQPGGLSLDPRDQPYGSGLGLAFNQRRELLMSTARPGVWMAERDGGWVRIGTPLFPDDPPPFEEQIEERLTQITPSQYMATGLGVIGDSVVVQGFLAFARPFSWDDPPGRDEMSYWLAFFDPDGVHWTSIPLPSGVQPSYLQADPTSGRLFVTATEPFPQVVELSLEVCDGTVAES